MISNKPKKTVLLWLLSCKEKKKDFSKDRDFNREKKPLMMLFGDGDFFLFRGKRDA